jgi:divalent metal cation (Fe/Co/Zn/Cd) transporter
VPPVPEGNEQLRRRALRLEWATIAWNGVEFAVTVTLGVMSRSLALVAFGLDTLVELFASVVVVWHLRGEDEPARRRRALRLVAAAFAAVAAALTVAAIRALVVGHEADESIPGIVYIALAVVAMLWLGLAKRRVAAAMGDDVVASEAVMSILDGVLALSVLTGLLLNAMAGWWWADPAATLVVAGFAFNEARESFEDAQESVEEAA